MNYPNPHGPSCPWFPVTESHGAPNIKWCEETLCQWVSEPANTWSNLGYLIVGLFITYLSFKKNDNFNVKQFGPIIFLMGAGSFYYHMSNFYTSQVLDFLGMFFLVGWVIGTNLIRLGKIKINGLWKFNLALAGVYTLATHTMYLFGIKFQMIVLFSAFIIITSEIMAAKMQKISYKWFYTSVVIMICAFSFSLSDHRRLWCDPSQHGWFSQGHAVWHWLGAMAMMTIYLHYSQPALQKEAQV